LPSLRQRPSCDVCTAPLTNKQWQLSDGQRICSRCHATAVYTPADATTLYENMKQVVVQILGLDLNIPTGLALVDRNQLADIIQRQLEGGKSTNPKIGENPVYNSPIPMTQKLDPQHTLGIYARRGMRRGIYVQTGLPRELFLQVAAHEYAHAWQGENCPILRDVLIHEGFAEWVAFHVIGHYGYVSGQQRLTDRQDLYGDGLRWALDLQTHQGVAGVIQMCRGVV
jgi:hypothetical protein